MSFAEPVINEEGRYAAMFRAGDNVTVEIVLVAAEGAPLGDEIDGLFQGLVDVVDGSSLFEFVSARKTQKISASTSVEPTVPL